MPTDRTGRGDPQGSIWTSLGCPATLLALPFLLLAALWRRRDR